jgi:hypothetical protein
MIKFFNATNDEGHVVLTLDKTSFVLTPQMARLLATQLSDASRRCDWGKRKGNKRYGVEE